MRLRDFDINLLTLMEAIWTTRSVSAAARQLNLAQSTVSATLNRLREQLEDDVFVWNGHEMVPTPLASQLMPDVSEVLSGVRSVLGKARGKLADVEQHLVIATADYVAALFGPELLKRMGPAQRALTLDFVEIKPQLINKSSLPDIDLFIFPMNALRVTGLRRRHLYRDSYICIGHADNDALYEGMPTDAFLALPHVGYSAIPRAVFSHESMLWDDLGDGPNYKITMTNYLVFLRIVLNSDAVAIVPRRMVEASPPGLPLKGITPPLPISPLDISMAWKAAHDDDKAHVWLRDTLMEISAGWGTPDGA